jgi:DNA-binding XRE family transcriptional regulator
MNLESIRKQRLLSQTQLDDAAGLRRGTVHDIEHGRSGNPSWETVSKLSKALGVTPEELFPIEGNGTAA